MIPDFGRQTSHTGELVARLESARASDEPWIDRRSQVRLAREYLRRSALWRLELG
ncbi:hypothetical protein ACFWTE_09425 [Nocardiopsis sp. NPDC058631]|uniref:hypothetical protein n=1 Tax=Nocardiopsis sp. NPDC058631 TaxID=3346566 RepID=UPI00364FFDE5